LIVARKKVAVLISGRGSNMVALTKAAKAKNYPAEIVLVISNRPEAKGLEFAKAEGIPATVIDHTAFPSREAFDAAIGRELESAKIDLVCLAGFMRVLTTEFVQHWQGRMLNIHPSLLPAFKGTDTHWHAINARAKTHGATVHFVVPELDSGPIVMQAEVPVLADDTVEKLAARVLKVEHKIYPAALKMLASEKIRIEGDRVVAI
jgi:phosphoribosylglycinamide formyltransferase-1